MDYNTIPMEKFKFANKAERVSDKKFDTKPVSYAKDVWTRFCKNKSSVVAACIILFLLLFSIFTPIFASSNYTNSLTDTTYLQYTLLLPKNKLLAPLGVWDGCKNTTLNQNDYNYWKAIEVETGAVIMPEIYRADYTDPSSTSKTTFYDVRMDTYVSNGMYYVTLTEAQFKDIQAWQNETGVHDRAGDYKEIYLTTGAQDGYDSLRVEGDDGSYRYAKVGGTSSAKTYECRVFKYTYFQYRYGEEPSFLFGTNAKGQDILTRLAAGARFSLLLALGVSFVNLFIGAIYGAIEGYYGGTVDIIMERISDVLGSVPSMVVMSLFQLHLASKVGPVWSLIFAFMLTGWIGMAARTRMQFYRFKKQEYILSARTLGASDGRLMFKHIFPNAMGTLITGSVLSIPGVIFSESSLTYLGIVNLESSTQTSVGTLLSGGNNLLSTHPHVILFPAIFISLLMISFTLFGNGLRDAFNPSLKGVED